MEESNQPRPGPPMPPPAPPQRPAGGSSRNAGSKASWIFGGVALALVLLLGMCMCGSCFFVTKLADVDSNRSGVGVIEITGVLSSDSGGFTGTSSRSIVEQLVRARRSDNVKAVLLRIDSPGGTPAAAQEVYREINRTKSRKPVVASIGDVGASGAYYIASAANAIYASPDSDVGSIGVILQIPNIEGLDEKIGVRWYVFTQGEFKDIGSPLRPPTPQEQEILMGQMKVAYDHFISDVAKARSLDESRVRELATGLTWPGTQAQEIGLVDNIGNYRDALDRAGAMGGIKGEIREVPLSRGGFFSLFSDFMVSIIEVADSLKTLVQQNGLSEDRPNER